MAARYPSTSNGAVVAAGSTNPRYWTAVFESGSGGGTAFAICVPD